MTDLAINPSVGTRTALASHWIFEQYRIWVPASPRIALGELGGYGLAVAAVLGIAASVLVICGSRAGDWSARKRGGVVTHRFRWEPPGVTLVAGGLAVTCIALSVTPVVVGYVLFPPRVAASSSALFPAFVCSLPAAFLSTGVAILLAAMIRWSSREARLLRFTDAHLYLLALAPLALPAVVVSVAAFYWSPGGRSASVLPLLPSWLAGHVLVSMPLLVAFCLWLHARVSDRELDYQRLAGLSPAALLKVSFVDRLRIEYLLVLLFGWGLAWNDAVVNRAVTSDLPSLYSTVSRQLSVRPDYRAAQFSLSISLATAIGMLLAWQRAVVRLGR